MINQKIKNYWIEKINELKFRKGVASNLLTENEGAADDSVWQRKLNELNNWETIRDYAIKNICQDIYAKATVVDASDVWPVSREGITSLDSVLKKFAANVDGRTARSEYWDISRESFRDLENDYLELVDIMQTRIGVDPLDKTIATDGDGNDLVDDDGEPVFLWEKKITNKLPNTNTKIAKLTDIPEGMDLTDLLYKYKLFEKITDDATGLPNLIEKELDDDDKVNACDWDWNYKLDENVLNNYKIVTDSAVNDLKNILGLAPTDPIPADWPTKLVKKSDLDTATTWIINLTAERNNYENQIRTACGLNATDAIPNGWETQVNTIAQYFINNLGITNANKLPTIPAGENLTSLLTKNTEYTRIHTKLNGKVSDSELQTLLDTVPSCSHSDYDTVKTERDTLKTENAELKEHKCDCESKVQAKETEIITKIITDLQLSTERERENVLEAVITEIKSKIIPPTDNNKDQKITELEKELSKLKVSKPQNEIVEKMTEFSKQLNFSESQISELKKSNSYQELFTSQRKMVEKKLNSEVQEKKHAQTLNYVLGTLSLGSLLLLAWVLIKRTSLTPEIGNKDKK